MQTLFKQKRFYGHILISLMFLFYFTCRAEQKSSGGILGRPDRGQRSLQMGSPYNRSPRHSVVSYDLSHNSALAGRIVILFSPLNFVADMIYKIWCDTVFFFLLLSLTVKVVCSKLIWHFPKTTPSGHPRWNLSQIFGTLMVSSFNTRWMIVVYFCMSTRLSR